MHIGRPESLVEREIEEVNRLLDQLTHVHHKSEADELARKLFRSARSAVNFLNDLPQLHPIASGVVRAVSVVIDLECQGIENDVHIAVVYASMALTVFHLRHFSHARNSFEEGFLKRAMNVLCNDMAKTIKKFGEFVDAYHIHWQRTVKLFFSYAYKKQLEYFVEEFDKLRRRTDGVYKSTMPQIQIETVATKTTEILDKIRFIDPDMLQAQLFVNAHGGVDAVLKNPTLMEEVAAQLEEKATHTMRNVLQGGSDALLQSDAPRYHMKYQSVEARLMQSERRIIEISEGPHKLIEDEEFQLVWLRLHEYYNGQIHQSHDSAITAEDAWTLEYLSRAMYYAAIGNIIDDDGSGYISALELNTFLQSETRCLPGWTKPQWFTFWASGWRNNNAWYRDEIGRMIQGIQDVMRDANPDPSNTQWTSASRILQSLKPLLLVVDNEDISNADDSRIPYQLLRLQQEFREYEEKTISDKLHHFGSYLVDSASIAAVVGDTRIELHLMALLYILAKRIHELTSKVAAQQNISSEDWCEIEAFATSCITVLVAFDNRLHDLSRGWHLEARDIGMQVDHYADGLFKKYYMKPWLFHEAYDDLRRSMFGDKHELPGHLRPIMRAQPPTLVNSVAILAKRVQELEVHLNENDATLEKLEKAPGPITTFMRKLKEAFLPRKTRWPWGWIRNSFVHQFHGAAASVVGA
ncbi:hypothetical protein ONZ51_g172 [Trametes cubensis]|uniref:EF-hand domain-containing protein n=1 Tax=Trametes cubensis TaxID=1111947 RepID=A0AAD7U609_9APHY|nr:hypothetical protein ONZ51_g172 [Trametes cubensis]